MHIGSSEGLSFGGGALTQVIADSTAVRTQLNDLTKQVSDGLVSDSYAGLGGGAAASLSLGASLGSVQTWQSNAQAASGPMQVAQSAMAQISSIASNFFAQAATLTSVNSSAIDTTAASARDALTQVAQLLDSKFGDIYVFSGTDSGNPPVPNASDILNSGMVTAISGAVGQLATNGAAATIASTLATASSNSAGISPFSSMLSQPGAVLQSLRPLVQTGPSQFTAVGILAGVNGDVASTGSSTTGSYIRDIMRALATVGSLSSGQASATGFTAIVQDSHTSLGDAITALNEDVGVLGNRQSSLTSMQQSLGDTATALQGQVSNVQDVDMAATLSRLTSTQTQLQASYQLLNTLRSLSLASVLAGTG
jgi:flagellar hook-associated protein 3 FlgL